MRLGLSVSLYHSMLLVLLYYLPGFRFAGGCCGAYAPQGVVQFSHVLVIVAWRQPTFGLQTFRQGLLEFRHSE